MWHSRFRRALVVGVVIGTTAASGVLWVVRADPGLPIDELVRVESIEHGDGTVLEDHMRWSFQVFGDQRPATEADISERFESSLEASAAGLNNFLDLVHETFGAITFVRYSERAPGFAAGLGVGDNGVPLVARISVADDGRIVSWTLDEESSAPRLPGWPAALLLVGGCLFLAVGAVAHRASAGRQAGVLVLAGVVTLSSVLVLSSSSFAYTTGRVVPTPAFVFAVWLLMGSQTGRMRAVALMSAGLAAGLAATAPLTRDANLIGHPDVLGSFVDSAAVYRGLLGGSSLLVGATLTLVLVAMVHQLRAQTRWRRPPEWAALALATVWGAAAFGSALDYAVGNGGWAGGALNTVALASLAAVPAVIAFRHVASRWVPPELAGLVIELEAGGAELQPAVARALEDPSVQVLTSPDGVRLLDEHRAVVRIDDVSVGRSLTQIRSGGRLIGGLIHDETLRQQSDRLRPVVAAVGLALEVGRLSEELAAQLREVQASRSRIIDASDAARRRIERDLHDGAQQRLVALGLELQRAKRLADTAGHHDFATLFESATAEVRGTLDDIRSVSRGSHPPLLAERGLGAAIDALAERSPVPVRTDVVAKPLPGPVEIIAYYVVAEGLANVAKHAAGATRASASVQRRNATAYVEISDDGCGGAVLLGGSGLEGLDDRVAAAGGTFSVQSGPAGTTLSAVIPCE